MTHNYKVILAHLPIRTVPVDLFHLRIRTLVRKVLGKVLSLNMPTSMKMAVNVLELLIAWLL